MSENVLPPDEHAIRVDLAACYRLVALYGWDDLIFTHISARLPGPEHHFLINPYGLMFEEITASSLVKIGLDGNPVGKSNYPVNPAGFTIHSAVHEVREDAGCVMHLHTPDGTAVSTSKERLLPLNQTAQLVLPDLAYHDYEGVALIMMNGRACSGISVKKTSCSFTTMGRWQSARTARTHSCGCIFSNAPARCRSARACLAMSRWITRPTKQ